MKKRLKTFVKGIMGGVCNSIGGWLYLRARVDLGSIVVASFLFTTGSVFIAHWFFYLFTGKIGFLLEKDDEKRRSKALANEIDTGTGNFTNKFVRDLGLLYKGRLDKPQMVVAYSKDQTDWFTIWTGNIICPYNGEKKPVIAMKRYINNQFLPELRDSIIEQEDVRAFKYKDLLTQTLWRKNMEAIKK